jgi:RNA polymerase sigma-70 factor (ECF subfamily)
LGGGLGCRLRFDGRFLAVRRHGAGVTARIGGASSHAPAGIPGAGLPTASTDDLTALDAIRAGDQDAFAALVDRYGAQMLRVAMLYAPSRAVAEDAVQDAWVGVLTGLGRFEGRSSLKTWIFRILMNRAMTRGARERRTVPFSAAWERQQDDRPAVDPDRFQDAFARWPGHWAVAPQPWDELPEPNALAAESLRYVQAAIDRLTPGQREVVTLRDVEGWTSTEVCNVLGITETNQRVLLHRGRSAVRRALEGYFDVGDGRDGPGGARE